MRKLYDSDSVEEILVGIIDRKKRLNLNRLVELKAVGMVTVEQHHEIEFLERVQRRYVDNLVRHKAQSRDSRGKDGKDPPAPQMAIEAQDRAINGKNGIAKSSPPA